MVLGELTFRDLDRKWFLLENKKEIKRINRLFHYKKSKYPLLCYCYIDHEAGISMRILGTIQVQNQEISLSKQQLEARMDILRYSEIESFHLTPVPDEIWQAISYTFDVIQEMDVYYTDKDGILASRQDTRLDPYRNPVLVDDVSFLIVDGTHPAEMLEGRICDYDAEFDRFCAEVLTEPEGEYPISVSSLVYLKYVDRPKYTGLAFLEKKEE